MASKAKTLTDFFPPLQQPSAERLKQTISSLNNSKCEANGIIPSHCSDDDGDGGDDGLSAVQKSRMEFQKLLAKSRRNLKICSERVINSQSEGGRGYVKLEELLVEESWLEALPGELQKPYAKNLCKFVESEICAAAVPVYSSPHLIFNALNSTPFDRVKAVVLGQDPYHGPGQAMGLSFSVPEGIKVPSSLVNIFKELKQDVVCSIPSHGNLENWAVQGVLLLNAVLTIRNHQANSHAKKGWEQFTDAVIKAISERKEGVVFLLWGNSAQEKRRLIDESKHHILKAAHPSGLSANRGFFGCSLVSFQTRTQLLENNIIIKGHRIRFRGNGYKTPQHFSRTNLLLEKMGIPPIDWQLQ